MTHPAWYEIPRAATGINARPSGLPEYTTPAFLDVFRDVADQLWEGVNEAFVGFEEIIKGLVDSALSWAEVMFNLDLASSRAFVDALVDVVTRSVQYLMGWQVPTLDENGDPVVGEDGQRVTHAVSPADVSLAWAKLTDAAGDLDNSEFLLYLLWLLKVGFDVLILASEVLRWVFGSPDGSWENVTDAWGALLDDIAEVGQAGLAVFKAVLWIVFGQWTSRAFADALADVVWRFCEYLLSMQVADYGPDGKPVRDESGHVVTHQRTKAELNAAWDAFTSAAADLDDSGLLVYLLWVLEVGTDIAVLVTEFLRFAFGVKVDGVAVSWADVVAAWDELISDIAEVNMVGLHLLKAVLRIALGTWTSERFSNAVATVVWSFSMYVGGGKRVKIDEHGDPLRDGAGNVVLENVTKEDVNAAWDELRSAADELDDSGLLTYALLVIEISADIAALITEFLRWAFVVKDINGDPVSTWDDVVAAWNELLNDIAQINMVGLALLKGTLRIVLGTWTSERFSNAVATVVWTFAMYVGGGQRVKYDEHGDPLRDGSGNVVLEDVTRVHLDAAWDELISAASALDPSGILSWTLYIVEIAADLAVLITEFLRWVFGEGTWEDVVDAWDELLKDFAEINSVGLAVLKAVLRIALGTWTSERFSNAVATVLWTFAMYVGGGKRVKIDGNGQPVRDGAGKVVLEPVTRVHLDAAWDELKDAADEIDPSHLLRLIIIVMEIGVDIVTLVKTVIDWLLGILSSNPDKTTWADVVEAWTELIDDIGAATLTGDQFWKAVARFLIRPWTSDAFADAAGDLVYTYLRRAHQPGSITQATLNAKWNALLIAADALPAGSLWRSGLLTIKTLADIGDLVSTFIQFVLDLLSSKPNKTTWADVVAAWNQVLDDIDSEALAAADFWKATARFLIRPWTSDGFADAVGVLVWTYLRRAHGTVAQSELTAAWNAALAQAELLPSGLWKFGLRAVKTLADISALVDAFFRRVGAAPGGVVAAQAVLDAAFDELMADLGLAHSPDSLLFKVVQAFLPWAADLNGFLLAVWGFVSAVWDYLFGGAHYSGSVVAFSQAAASNVGAAWDALWAAVFKGAPAGAAAVAPRVSRETLWGNIATKGIQAALDSVFEPLGALGDRIWKLLCACWDYVFGDKLYDPASPKVAAFSAAAAAHVGSAWAALWGRVSDGSPAPNAAAATLWHNVAINGVKSALDSVFEPLGALGDRIWKFICACWDYLFGGSLYTGAGVVAFSQAAASNVGAAWAALWGQVAGGAAAVPTTSASALWGSVATKGVQSALESVFPKLTDGKLSSSIISDFTTAATNVANSLFAWLNNVFTHLYLALTEAMKILTDPVNAAGHFNSMMSHIGSAMSLTPLARRDGVDPVAKPDSAATITGMFQGFVNIANWGGNGFNAHITATMQSIIDGVNALATGAFFAIFPGLKTFAVPGNPGATDVQRMNYLLAHPAQLVGQISQDFITGLGDVLAGLDAAVVAAADVVADVVFGLIGLPPADYPFQSGESKAHRLFRYLLAHLFDWVAWPIGVLFGVQPNLNIQESWTEAVIRTLVKPAGAVPPAAAGWSLGLELIPALPQSKVTAGGWLSSGIGDASAAAAAAHSAADDANSAATNALDKATIANTAADRAETTAGLASAAADRAETTAGEANTAADRAETTAGLANAAATRAETTAGLANAAADRAETTAGLANAAADRAETTAGLANAAADRAETTAGLANAAADRAETTAGLANAAANRAEATTVTLNGRITRAETVTIPALDTRITKAETVTIPALDGRITKAETVTIPALDGRIGHAETVTIPTLQDGVNRANIALSDIHRAVVAGYGGPVSSRPDDIDNEGYSDLINAGKSLVSIAQSGQTLGLGAAAQLAVRDNQSLFAGMDGTAWSPFGMPVFGSESTNVVVLPGRWQATFERSGVDAEFNTVGWVGHGTFTGFWVAVLRIDAKGNIAVMYESPDLAQDDEHGQPQMDMSASGNPWNEHRLPKALTRKTSEVWGVAFLIDGGPEDAYELVGSESWMEEHPRVVPKTPGIGFSPGGGARGFAEDGFVASPVVVAATDDVARFSVTVDHTLVGESLIDFPLLVNLAHMPQAFWDTVTNGGGDIRCFSGNQELPREVVSCNTANKTGELHVRCGLSAGVDTVIRVEVDGVSPAYAPTDPFGRNAVWANGYAYVSHMVGLAGHGSFPDSTGNGLDGAAVGGGTTAGGGKLGGSTGGFNGTQCVDLGNDPELQLATATVSAWWKGTDPGTGLRGMIIKTSAYGLHLFNGVVASFDWGASAGRISGKNVADGAWHHVAAVFQSGIDGGSALFADGVNALNFTQTVKNQTSRCYVGSASPGVQAITGTIDEVRIANVARTPAWIAAEYANQNNPSSFYTVGQITEAFAITSATTLVAAGPNQLLLSNPSGQVAAAILNETGAVTTTSIIELIDTSNPLLRVDTDAYGAIYEAMDTPGRTIHRVTPDHLVTSMDAAVDNPTGVTYPSEALFPSDSLYPTAPVSRSGFSIGGVASVPDGRVLVYDNDQSQLLTLDFNTGRASQYGFDTTIDSVTGIAITADASTALMLNTSTQEIVSVSLGDLSAGFLPVAVPAGWLPVGITCGEDTTHAYMLVEKTSVGRVLSRVDLGDGAVDFVSATPGTPPAAVGDVVVAGRVCEAINDRDVAAISGGQLVVHRNVHAYDVAEGALLTKQSLPWWSLSMVVDGDGPRRYERAVRHPDVLVAITGDPRDTPIPDWCNTVFLTAVAAGGGGGGAVPGSRGGDGFGGAGGDVVTEVCYRGVHFGAGANIWCLLGKGGRGGPPSNATGGLALPGDPGTETRIHIGSTRDAVIAWGGRGGDGATSTHRAIRNAPASAPPPDVRLMTWGQAAGGRNKWVNESGVWVLDHRPQPIVVAGQSVMVAGAALGVRGGAPGGAGSGGFSAGADGYGWAGGGGAAWAVFSERIIFSGN